uniref:Uncharacterized protein n=1 Tax=Aplanochytrium stocchinoi TaxID=215587 RepID=A0A7S3V2A5_9STRA|eukprot:CAMPEP_0204824480 /NCGR_PEP_ID=MMETSP1346-20131115/2494_1 /ASSEMBLY_ACC=CAM_ASM_000771 /TAXON_ID=215587 /ORGANISM="Aplanochytrium stocchinoi, Strain GSBS06" /LENGTH=843 /DNA_ID=CAMNT_0051951649 /DNA_START=250 /DNA_END=2781 /DNA_ORIENTATION=-
MSVLKVSVLLLLVTQISVADTGENCLNPQEDEQLKTSIKFIEKALDVVSLGLNAAAEIEKEEDVKEKLKQASVIVTLINKDLISNLTEIVEEACGHCSDILKTVKDAVADIEKTLLDIDPDWKDDPIYQTVTTAIDAVVKIAESLCSSKAAVMLMDDEDCLTPKQDKELKVSINYIEKFLEVASFALKAAAELEKDEKIKQQLEEAATIIISINENLVFDLTRIVEEACGHCSDIMKAINDAVDDIEKALLDIEPAWKDDPIYKAVTTAVDAIVKVGEDLCRTDPEWDMSLRVAHKKHAHLLKKDSCLTPEQDKEIEEVTKFAEWVFNVAVIGLNHAASKLPDGEKKTEIRLAARILQDISNDIIKNIKAIVDEDCGTCTDIVKAVLDAFDDIEKLFTDIDPEWEKNHVFEAVTHAMKLFINRVRQLCPSNQKLVKQDCLTPQQDEQLKISIKYIEKLLGAAVLALDTAAAVEQDPEIKAKVTEAAVVIKAINQDLVSKLTKIVEEACGSCSDIVDTINDAIDAIVETLAGIDPNWEKGPKFQALAAAIKFIVKFAERICSRSMSTMEIQNSCLTPQQDKELGYIADFAEKGFDVAAIGLRRAAFKQSDEGLKQEILEAADDVQAISDDTVKNLKSIADEACGTCSEVVQAIEDSFDALDQKFKDIDPNWKSKAVFEALGYAMNLVFDKIKVTCERGRFPGKNLNEDPCLKPEEREQMDKIVNYVNEFLNAAAVAIENTLSRIDDQDMKEKLKMVEIVVRAVNKDIVQNIEKIANEACGSCADVVKAIQDSLKYLQQTVKDIDPDWERNPAFSVLEVAIDGALKMANELCSHVPSQSVSVQIY